MTSAERQGVTMMGEQSLRLANRPSQGSERSYTTIYERLRETVDREVAAAAPTRDWRRLCSLLAAEQRAWVHAYGSDSVEAAAALDGNARYPSALVEKAWLTRRRSEFGSTRGAIHSKRLPGSHEVERFVMVEDPARPGTVKPVNVRGAVPLEGLNAQYGLDHLIDQACRKAPRLQPRAFLSVRAGDAHFVVSSPDGTGRRVVSSGHVADIEPQLAAVAMHPKDALRLIRRIEFDRIRAFVQANCRPRPLRQVPVGAVVKGHVHAVLSDSEVQHTLVLRRDAVHYAVVATSDAVHLVRVGEGEQAKQHAKEMQERPVELSRSSEGLRLSFSRAVDRTVVKLWAKAREDGLGR